MFVLKDVCHVPKLTKSLISARQLDDEGYTCIYGDKSWKISKGLLQVEKGTNLGSLYTLHVSSVNDHVILVVEQPSLSLWHRRTYVCHWNNKTSFAFGLCLALVSQICLYANTVCMVGKLFCHTRVAILVRRSDYS